MHIFFEENMVGYRELKKRIEMLFLEAEIDDFADIDWIMCEILNVKRSMLPLYGEISDEQEVKCKYQLISKLVISNEDNAPMCY